MVPRTSRGRPKTDSEDKASARSDGQLNITKRQKRKRRRPRLEQSILPSKLSGLLAPWTVATLHERSENVTWIESDHLKGTQSTIYTARSRRNRRRGLNVVPAADGLRFPGNMTIHPLVAPARRGSSGRVKVEIFLLEANMHPAATLGSKRGGAQDSGCMGPSRFVQREELKPCVEPV